jgi:hypothetical protein
MLYCDHCGDPIKSTECYSWNRLPVDIDSANAGECAVVCGTCCDDILRRAAVSDCDPVTGQEYGTGA